MNRYGLFAGVAIAAIIVACAGPQNPGDPPWGPRQRKLDEMDRRLAEIRAWRHERGIRVEPTSMALNQAQKETPQQAKNVCPANPVVPKSCSDICILGDDICDNTEHICDLADQLGKDDKEGQDRCTSAKASCHDAKQRCCDCVAQDAAAAKDGAK